MSAVNVFNHEFTGPWKGKTSIRLGSYINGEFVTGTSGKFIDVFNPTTGQILTQLHEGSPQDVDKAVQAARTAFQTSWGLNVPAASRGKMLLKLADLIEEHADELASIEALDNGKAYTWARAVDLTACADCFRYYGGWADKNHGQTIESNPAKFNYTRHEPIGVCGQIIPWNFPLMMMAWKLGPALACGNTVVFKPSELTSLSTLRVCELLPLAGFPPGVVNVVLGYGTTVGHAISSHMGIDKIAFTGSTLVGRSIMKAAAASNLKKVTLELGGKSPAIVFEDADIDQAVAWAANGIFFNQGQVCIAGSRIFVQSSIYEAFLAKFTARIQALKLGNPFSPETFQGPQVSQQHYDRIMGYIESGKQQGATCYLGGTKWEEGDKGYFINPTVFTDVEPGMKIVQEEIFGPVSVVVKFDTAEDVVKIANDTVYGLAASVFTRNITRAINTANQIQAGSVWINCSNMLDVNVPLGGFKQSGFGKELGQYALDCYTNVKSIHVNLGMQL